MRRHCRSRRRDCGSASTSSKTPPSRERDDGRYPYTTTWRPRCVLLGPSRRPTGWRSASSDGAVGYVVVNEAGAALSPHALTSKWAPMLKAANVRHIRFHDARHTCGTLMHLEDVPIAVISAWLGHESKAFTMATYVHSQPDALSTAVQSFARVVTNRDNSVGSNVGSSAETASDHGGRCRIRTCVGVSRRIYSPSLSVFVTSSCVGCRTRLLFMAVGRDGCRTLS